MWWAEDSDFRIDELRRLAALLGESGEGDYAPVPREVFGFGSAKVDGQRVLTAVVHEGMLDRSVVDEIRRSKPAWAKVLPSLFGHRRPPKPSETLFEWSELNGIGRAKLEKLSLPGDTHFMLADWPRPCLRVPCTGGAILASEKSGTLGLVLADMSSRPHRALATTAGHVIGLDARGRPARDTVELRARWWQERHVIGHPIDAFDPTQGAGPDVAFVELLSHESPCCSRNPEWVGRVRPVTLAPVPAPEGSIGTLFGGKSGRRRGWVDNPQMQIRGSDDRVRQWTNCWTMFEIGGGFAQPGDSGGIVLNDDGEIIGHLVASMGVITRRGRRQAGIVQDIHTVLSSRSNYQPMIADPPPRDWLGRIRRG